MDAAGTLPFLRREKSDKIHYYSKIIENEQREYKTTTVYLYFVRHWFDISNVQDKKSSRARNGTGKTGQTGFLHVLH